MVTDLSTANSLVSQWLAELRDTRLQKDRMRFRKNVERIGEVMAYEISKTLSYTPLDVTTPLATASCHELAQQPVIVSVLRAGIPLYQGLLNYFDRADSAFLGSYRRHHADNSFEIAQLYITHPPLSGRPLIIADPMLATGASLVTAITSLLAGGTPSAIHIACVIAAPEGIEHLTSAFPQVHIWTAAIDDGLTATAYITPGLGDAGDLSFGEKLQA